MRCDGADVLVAPGAVPLGLTPRVAQLDHVQLLVLEERHDTLALTHASDVSYAVGVSFNQARRKLCFNLGVLRLHNKQLS